MPEWLVERGIGETRAALVEAGEIVEARIELDGSTPSGSVVRARLRSSGANGRNAVAISEAGIEYLLPRGAAGITEGAAFALEVTREAIPGSEPWKRPLGRATDKPLRERASLLDQFDCRPLAFPDPSDALGRAGWNDLIDQARSGVVPFAGGELRIAATPAMTVFDVDGYLEPGALAVTAAAEVAATIRRMDIGGSIGVDLPTVGSRSARQAAAAAIDARLPPPFERTAVNGFGFLQVVLPRLRPSLIELAADRAGFEARALLRQAALGESGARRLVAHPAVIAVIERNGDWLSRLSRAVGGRAELRGDASLPISGGYDESL